MSLPQLAQAIVSTTSTRPLVLVPSDSERAPCQDGPVAESESRVSDAMQGEPEGARRRRLGRLEAELAKHDDRGLEIRQVFRDDCLGPPFPSRRDQQPGRLSGVPMSWPGRDDGLADLDTPARASP